MRPNLNLKWDLLVRLVIFTNSDEKPKSLKQRKKHDVLAVFEKGEIIGHFGPKINIVRNNTFNSTVN